MCDDEDDSSPTRSSAPEPYDAHAHQPVQGDYDRPLTLRSVGSDPLSGAGEGPELTLAAPAGDKSVGVNDNTEGGHSAHPGAPASPEAESGFVALDNATMPLQSASDTGNNPKARVELEVQEQPSEPINGVDQVLRGFLDKLMVLKPSYVGIYQPGDFSLPTYRAVIPDPFSVRTGRGYRGWREEIVFEHAERRVVDMLVQSVLGLVGIPSGPLAARHILNPSHAKDEGLRLIWAHDGPGQAEVDDWPRRDRLMREGKTVREEGASAFAFGVPPGMAVPVVVAYELPEWPADGYVNH